MDDGDEAGQEVRRLLGVCSACARFKVWRGGLCTCGTGGAMTRSMYESFTVPTDCHRKGEHVTMQSLREM